MPHPRRYMTTGADALPQTGHRARYHVRHAESIDGLFCLLLQKFHFYFLQTCLLLSCCFLQYIATLFCTLLRSISHSARNLAFIRAKQADYFLISNEFTDFKCSVRAAQRYAGISDAEINIRMMSTPPPEATSFLLYRRQRHRPPGSLSVLPEGA